jgi:predicted Kef-type K+ transport protein
VTTQLLYRDLAYVFLAAVVGGVAARALRQPLILGYVVAGMLVGPFTPGPTLSNVHAVGLTQIGEFSYVLVQVARNAHLVDDSVYNATLMASMVSIVLNAIAVRVAMRGSSLATLPASSCAR